MRGVAGAAAVAVFVVGFGGAASAGVYEDDLKRCLVKSVSPEDKVNLARWVFATMTAHPAVAPFSTVTPVQREGVSKSTTKIMERVLLVNCRTQTVEAVKYEGPATIQASMQTLGEVAMAELMNNAAVRAEVAKLDALADKAQWEALDREITGDSAPAPKLPVS